jgi:transposase
MTKQNIMIGCDLHDRNMRLRIGIDCAEPVTRTVLNTEAGRRGLIEDLKREAVGREGGNVILAYEASGLGFGWHDELTAAGIDCRVLAPTKIKRSNQHRRRKNDDTDSLQIFEDLRGHVLAGNALPTVWIPSLQLRDDRELVRMRLEVTEKITTLKIQVQSLLKRHTLRRAPSVGKGWCQAFRRWLRQDLVESTGSPLATCSRLALGSLLRQLEAMEAERGQLDKELEQLAQQPRYAAQVAALTRIKGVGVLTAMVFLTELGDLSRFRNRKQIGAFVGLVPSSNESGETNDRKGHITRQGPWRVRKVLCQAVWSIVRSDPNECAFYQQLVARNPKHKKIAVVACMRRLAIKMWHRASEAGRGDGSLGTPARSGPAPIPHSGHRSRGSLVLRKMENPTENH